MNNFSEIYTKKSLSVGRNDYDEFMRKICVMNKNNIPYGFVQKPETFSALTVDVDIKLKGETLKATESRVPLALKELYTLDEVERLVDFIYQFIKSRFHSELEGVYLFQKTPYLLDGCVKHGFHLMSCNFYVSDVIREYILKTLKEEAVKINPLFSVDVIPNHFWLMYGSSKSLSSGTYRTTYSFEFLNDKSICVPTIDFISNHSIKIYEFKNEKEIKYEKSEIEYFYPMFFNINPFGANINYVHSFIVPSIEEVKYNTVKQEDFTRDIKGNDIECIMDIIKDEYVISKKNSDNGFVNCDRVKVGPCCSFNDIHHNVGCWFKLFNDGGIIMGCSHPDHNATYILIRKGTKSKLLDKKELLKLLKKNKVKVSSTLKLIQLQRICKNHGLAISKK
jgi:hypothetical protein